MSHHASSSSDEPPVEQLELFEVEPAASTAGDGVDRAVARASVSPGWWPLVAPVVEHPGILVQECREVDGRLYLRATRPEYGQDNAGATFPTSSWLQRICDIAAQRCGCCGASPASPYRRRLTEATRVVCPACRERLKGGESYLSVADDYWCLDGSRRADPARRMARARSGERTAAAVTRSPAKLAPDELRAAVGALRAAMSREIVGQDDAVARLALVAGLHLGGGLARGGRLLLLGPSGVGKTSLVLALRHALEEGGWDVPFVMTDALDLTSPGWSGAPSMGGLLGAALGSEPPDSARARHAVVVIDEIHHAGATRGLTGNMAAKRQEVLASLLPLVGHGRLHLGEEAREWSSRNALVIAMGAFTGLLDPARVPTPADLVAAGLPLELATRFEEIVLLRPLEERQLVALLRRWPALVGLVEVCERLGHPVRIHDEAYARAARAVMLGGDGATARTAGGWLVAAVREALVGALAAGGAQEIVITPDSLSIARASMRRPGPDDPQEGDGGWDATLILSRR